MPTHTPAADLYASKDAFLLVLDVPGVAEDEVDVTVEGRALTLRAGGGEDAPPGWFHRFRLPQAADPEGIAARHAEGVLELRIPRLSGSGPRRVSVNAAP